MSDKPDPESKTEEPTQKKVHDALEKGNTAHSRELVVFGSLVGIVLSCQFLLVAESQVFVSSLQAVMSRAGDRSIGGGSDAIDVAAESLSMAARLAAPMIALMMLLGIIAALCQSKPQFVLDRIRPKMSRLSFSAGWKRLFGSEGRTEFIKVSVKFLSVAGISAMVIASEKGRIHELLLLDPTVLSTRTLEMSVRILSALAIASLFIVIVDVFWSRMHWLQELRMTRNELKDEVKESEGDPWLKARRRSVSMQRRRNRMINSVPTASLVITNPIHFAVALRYRKGIDAAPVVIAKGMDKLAIRIRDIAKSRDIPVVEEPMLARSLFKVVDLDQMIHPEFYKAVAEIILFVSENRSRSSQSLKELRGGDHG